MNKAVHRPESCFYTVCINIQELLRGYGASYKEYKQVFLIGQKVL